MKNGCFIFEIFFFYSAQQKIFSTDGGQDKLRALQADMEKVKDNMHQNLREKNAAYSSANLQPACRKSAG